MYYERKYTSVMLALTLLGLWCSCASLEKDRRVIIVLIDYSASSSNKVLNDYIRIINEDVFKNMRQYDYLAVMPIDEGSKKEPVKIIDEDMLEKKFTRKNDGFAHAQDSSNLRLKEYVETEAFKIEKVLKEQKDLRKIYTDHTDIVGALQQTSNFIETNVADDVKTKSWNFVIGKSKVRSENIIVLLSDMVHNSEEFSFNSSKKHTAKQYSAYLEQIKQENKIPDLQGCKVFVIGSTGDNSTQIDRIGDFWKEYFNSAHADLRAYGYSVDDKLRKYLKQEND